jgi:hypothetical protein
MSKKILQRTVNTSSKTEGASKEILGQITLANEQASVSPHCCVLQERGKSGGPYVIMYQHRHPTTHLRNYGLIIMYVYVCMRIFCKDNQYVNVCLARHLGTKETERRATLLLQLNKEQTTSSIDAS